jgi:hypothetical protein
VPAPWCGPYSLGRTLKPEREAGTAGVAVLNRNARHMRVGNAPYDCKAEARASRLTAIMTPKTTKQKFTLVLVYSRTLIKDPNGSIRHPAVKGVSRFPLPKASTSGGGWNRLSKKQPHAKHKSKTNESLSHGNRSELPP